MEDLLTFEEELLSLFNNSIGVHDTIWYTKDETLYEAIVWLAHKHGVVI